MRILVLSNEVWNDQIHGNNMASNLFDGMDAEFANIYASPGVPYNKCCQHYFQITDMMMLKSILTGRYAGCSLPSQRYDIQQPVSIAEPEPKNLYRFLKRISGHLLRLVREVLWLLGRYDTQALCKFIQDFQPDVVFSERMATCKMLRLERIVSGLTDAPMFAFTGDDEYSLRRFSFSPFFWLNRFMVRKSLRSNVKDYKVYYTLSKEQKEFYEKEFGCCCKLLRKCGEFQEVYHPRAVGDPIRIVYAGKFYCNRWKVLGDIAEALRKINRDQVKIVLEIYTKDVPNKRQNRVLNDGRSSIIKGAVTQEQLREIYNGADIALHVESSDIVNRLITRFSFSTKIIDCVFSGCAVMAYCWKEQSGWKYLHEEDAAICVNSPEQLRKILERILENPKIVTQYAYQAYLCGQRNHTRQNIQAALLNDFSNL